MTILIETESLAIAALQTAVGTAVAVADAVAATRLLADDQSQNVVVVGPTVDLHVALDLAAGERIERPHVGVILVRRRVDTSVLKDALRAGIREVVKLEDVDGLTEACDNAERLAQHVRGDAAAEAGAADQNDKLGELVTVFSAKGGCGKTTVATNLAVALAKAGKSVCLVDLDLAFGDVAISLQLFPTHTIADAVALRRLDETAVRGLVTRHSSGLDALLAPVEPGVAEAVTATVVCDVINALKRMYDVVVADTAAAVTDQALAAFDATDHFLLLATLDIPAIKNLKLTLELLEVLGYPRERWHPVLNRADSKVGLSVDDVQKMLNLPISAQIPSSRAVPASINRGVPIVLDAPGHGVSQSIVRLAKSLEPARTIRRAAKPRAFRGLRREKVASS